MPDQWFRSAMHRIRPSFSMAVVVLCFTGLVRCNATPRGVATAGDAVVNGLQFSGRHEWDAGQTLVRFQSSGSMPDSKEQFFWDVPSTVREIVIGAGVTVAGGFRVQFRHASNPLTIRGVNRETSVIHGTEVEAWTESAGIPESEKWRYGAISVVEDAVVHVENLTSKNPRGYNISGYADAAVIHVHGCNLLDTRPGDNNNSDGFVGAAGSSIRDSFISTADDAIKAYHDITIEDVIVEQHRNGAALQFGWSDENDSAKVTIRNLTVRGVSKNHRYNMAPLTWEAGQNGVRHVTIDGLRIAMNGELYDESREVWVPIGLVELKPADCRFDLEVVRADLGGIAPGLRQTPGNLSVDGRVWD